jgi:amino acid adenylation domain-containing protein
MSDAAPRPGATDGSLRDLQLLLWLGQKLAPESPGFNLPFRFEIDGPVDPAHFEAAVRAFVERSDAARLVFPEVDGEPRSRVASPLDYPVEHLDLSADPDPEARLRSWLAARAARAFRMDLRLFDTALVRLGERRFVWYWNQHHLATDGWSYQLMLRRVAEYYRLSRQGALAAAPPLPSFAHFVAAENTRRSTRPVPRAGGADGAPAALEWYGRRAAPKSLGERRITRRLGPERTAALRCLAASPGLRSLGADLSVLELLAAATAAYVHRVTGGRRFSLGIPFHNRMTPADREVIGLVQEMIAIDLELSEDETFRSLATQCDAGIWRGLRRARSGASHGPRSRYEVLLNYPAVAFVDFDGLPVRATWLHPGVGDGQRSLFIQVVDFDAADDLTLLFDANAGVFGEALAQRAAGHYLNVLDGLLRDPDRRIAGVDLLGPDERDLVVRGFNRTDAAYPAGESLTDLFEAQVDRTPDREALVLGDRSLSYRDLDRAANRLAHHLRARGAGPGTPIASCVERSVDAVVGLLAIWKCGAAYVPLDPTYPRDRLGFVLEDSGARLLLTQDRLLALLPARRPETIVLDQAPLDGLPADRPAGRASLADLGYVIYTSGSTGKPKGVAMSQGALANLVRWQMEQPTALRQPRTLQYTPLTFDVSLQEMLATWGVGGTLVLILEETRRDPEATLRLIVEQRIERLFIIYTPFQRLAEAAERCGLAPACLREVITAGEQLQITPAVRRFFERLPGCALHNQYGPSETHIVTAYPLPGTPADWPALPSIGAPIANTQTYVLDAERRPVPVGVIGELYIGGAQVADGYIRRPELTAERFVPDPFRPEAAAGRLYRTGDLARWLPEGTLEFLGRLDHQIKLRGHRIELGEIESVLADHPAVKEAVVAARRGPAGELRLVGYVVPLGARHGGPNEPLTPGLRRWLQDRLPEPMIPSAFVLLDALPQTPNGKVDRLALPEPDGTRPELEAAYLAPETDLERRIAAVWRRALGVDRVGREDNFFDLGGHSLLLVEMQDELRRVVGRPLSIVDLFRLPTIASLVRFVEGAEPDRPLDPLVARAGRQRAALTAAPPGAADADG